MLLLPEALGAVAADRVSVSYNSTGSSVDTILTVGSVSAPLAVSANVATISVRGFQASVANFVSLSGNLDIRKESSGELLAIGQGFSASLASGSAYLRVVGADFGLKSMGNAMTFELSHGRFEAGLPGFTEITSSDFRIQYNDVSAAALEAGHQIQIGDRKYTFEMSIDPGVATFSVTGFRADLGDSAKSVVTSASRSPVRIWWSWLTTPSPW